MSAYGTLEPTLEEILRVINPMGTDWSVRIKIIDDLRAVVASVESLRGATVEPYGSFVSNLFSRWGDLDLSIEIPNSSHILCAGKKLKQALLADVLKALRKSDYCIHGPQTIWCLKMLCVSTESNIEVLFLNSHRSRKAGGWHRLVFVANARIPILKCERNYANISCDISISNLSCQMKSKMLYWFKEIDGRFRMMVLLVKEWAKAHGINDSRSGSFNSYCLSLLVIFHFQTCVPAILPPMREIYPGNMVDDLKGVRVVAEKQIEETCADNIEKFNRSKQRNSLPLFELFVSFLAKFSNIKSWAPTQGICLHTGQWEDIDTNMRWLPKTYSLFVEDPFEKPANTARSVTSKQLVKISEAFQVTLQKINTCNQIPGSIVPYLVTPQVFNLLPRMMLDDPSVGYNIMAQLPRNMPNHGPFPLHDHQTRYGRRDVLPNNHRIENGKRDVPSSSHHAQNGKRVDFGKRAPAKANVQRAGHVPQIQEQLVWRPRSD